MYKTQPNNKTKVRFRHLLNNIGSKKNEIEWVYSTAGRVKNVKVSNIALSSLWGNLITSVRPSTPFLTDTDTPIFCCQPIPIRYASRAAVAQRDWQIKGSRCN